jgi:hypothetical protein
MVPVLYFVLGTIGLIIQTLVSIAVQAFFVYRIYICAYGPSNPYFLLTAVQLAGRTSWHHSYGVGTVYQ